jgi:Flp pilus assembly pilin Flp
MMNQLLRRLPREERGQTMAEYAVVMAVITLAVVATLALLSTKIASVVAAITALV